MSFMCSKFFTLVQALCKIIVPLLHLRARIQYRAGFRKEPTSFAAEGFKKFAGMVGDSQTLGRFWGLLQIFQWLISLERTPQPTRNLLTIERLQGWSMLGYYPLEHLSHLRSHDILPPSISIPVPVAEKPKQLELDAGALSRASCRFWAAYVVLQFAHLREDRKLLQLQQRALKKSKVGGKISDAEKAEFARRWDAYWSGLLTNICNLPIALHWSVTGGIIKNSLVVDILSLLAAVLSFRSGWRATALLDPEEESDNHAGPPVDEKQ
ncbi:unnamed protein product [Mycena citricolor]|uniref:Uncharacterized protein n=1 Tax=Mycena citricolor TaxID=2018698 RepID=A0AAD2H5Z1_9AGAR|nr:unnamed protein product [Mycena citricolor]CAK5269214.1 unnamed protein product [Mycena citricolor]